MIYGGTGGEMAVLCPIYWTGGFQGFTGGGNVFQNALYLMGYTGNSSFTLSGEVAVHDIVSDTGSVRGIGLCTHSEMTNDELNWRLPDLWSDRKSSL